MQSLNSIYHTIFPNPQAGLASIPAGNWKQTARKVEAVALCLLLLSAPAFAMKNPESEMGFLVMPLLVSGASILAMRNTTGVCMSSSLPKTVAPYAAALSDRVQPDADGVIGEFPDWLPKFHYNGLVATPDGTRYCKFRDFVPSSELCDVASEKIEQQVSIQDPALYAKLKSSPEQKREEGGFAQLPDGNLFRYLANPQKIKNQRAVLNYLEETILKDPMEFFGRSEEDILNVIHKTHELFCKKIQNPNMELRPGQYRNEISLVSENKGDQGTFEEFKRILLKKGGTKRDEWHLKKILKKMSKYPIREALAQFTKAEMKVFRKIAFIPTLPEHIPEKMRNFVQRFKEIGPQVVRGELDGLAAAAWFHQEFGKIHPYNDYNGHSARGYGNVLMQLGGYHAVVFPDDDVYSAAVEEDQGYPGQFARHLEDVIAWNRRQRELV